MDVVIRKPLKTIAIKNMQPVCVKHRWNFISIPLLCLQSQDYRVANYSFV